MPIVEHLIRPDDAVVPGEDALTNSADIAILKALSELSSLSKHSGDILGSLAAELKTIDHRIHRNTARVDLFVKHRIPLLEQPGKRSLQVCLVFITSLHFTTSLHLTFLHTI